MIAVITVVGVSVGDVILGVSIGIGICISNVEGIAVVEFGDIVGVVGRSQRPETLSCGFSLSLRVYVLLMVVTIVLAFSSKTSFW